MRGNRFASEQSGRSDMWVTTKPPDWMKYPKLNVIFFQLHSMEIYMVFAGKKFLLNKLYHGLKNTCLPISVYLKDFCVRYPVNCNTILSENK